MSDLLLVGADVVTMDHRVPQADAVLVRDGLVVAVGTETEVATLAAEDAERLDLAGATVVPGLIESHVHPAYTGLTDLWADCRSPGVGSIADLQAALADLRVETGPGSAAGGTTTRCSPRDVTRPGTTSMPSASPNP